MRKASKVIIFFILPAILVLLVAAMIALPHVAKNYINKHGKEYTGRKLSVNQIGINYLKTTFNIIDFKMFEADETSTFVAFDTLTVKINPLRLFSSELDIEKIRLVKPVATIIRKDSIFNFDDIIAFFNSKPKDTVSKASKPLKYVLKNISLEQGKLTFTDKGVNFTKIMTNLGFTVPYIRYDEAEISEAGVKFYFENGGFFQAKADYNQKNGAYNADLSVNQLDISPFLPYVKDYYRFKSMAGMVNGNFHLNGNISKLDSLTIRGDGKVSDFQANDLSGRKVLAARQAAVTLKDSYPMKFVFKMDKITLTEPYVYFEMKDSTYNLLGLMVETPESGEPFNYYYQINHFKIESGLLDFRDNSYGDPFDYHFDDIAMSVDSVSSTAKWLTAYSTMRLNKRGKLKAELGINPSNPYELKVDYVITNFQLSDLSTLSRYWVGFPIILGNMYYKGKTVITARQLTSENKLIIRNAKLGKKSGGLMNIPLKIALYLLKDVHGDITLDLPVSGDLNDPKTKIGKLVWQVFKNFIVKIVASPFRALSSLVGVNPDEIKGIEFNYADTTLTAQHLRRIKLFTEVEKKKPDMKIELAYYNDAGLEKQAIAVEEAGKLFNTATGADFKKDKAQFSAFLAEKLKSDTVNVIKGSILLIGNQKLDSIQNSIVQKRIHKIEAALHAADDSTKIKVTIPNKEVPENVGSRPDFELKCSMDE
jgi:hypothetical protein